MLVGVAWLAGCVGSSGTDRAADPVIRERAIAVADTWIADHPPDSMRWDWGEGVLAFGMLELARTTGETRFEDYVRSYVAYHDAAGISYRMNDQLTPALSAAILLLREGGAYPEAFDGALNYIFAEAPRTPSGGLRHLGLVPIDFIADLWVDSLFHFVPLLVCAHLLDPQPRYLDEAAWELLLFAEHMQDPSTDLFTHAWRDVEDLQVPSFAEGMWWARGNGWVFAAMVDLLAVLPAEHPAYAEILRRCRALDAALRRAQAADGRYHTVLLDAATYPEPAATGLITYAMARGARQRILGSATWRAAQSGMQGLQTTLLIDADSGRIEVDGTSLGTIPIARLYATIPTDKQVSYGVGAWLLAATAGIRE